MSAPRRERTELQQRVARMVDDAIERLLDDLSDLVRDEVTEDDVAVALAMEHVDLDDAWTDYCQETS